MAKGKTVTVAATPAAVLSLAAFAAACNSESGFAFFSQADMQPLVNDGMIEINPQMTNNSGGIAGRLTDKGRASLASKGEKQTITSADVGKVSAAGIVTATASEYELLTDLVAPEKKRGGRSGRNSKYPFDTMPVGTGFFIPATAEKPDAAKAYASTVTSAMDRHSIVVKDANGKVETETVNIPSRKLKDGSMSVARSEVREKMQRTKRFVIWNGDNKGVKGAFIKRTA